MRSQAQSFVTLLAFLLASACGTRPAPTRAVAVPSETLMPASTMAPTASVANPSPSSSPGLSTVAPTSATAIPTPVVTRSRNQLTLLQYAPNGSLVAVAQAALLLIDPTSLAVIWSAPLAGDCCASVVVADNSLAGIGEGASAAYVWDIATGQMLHRLEDESAQFSALALSPDGSLLATAGESQIQLWDAVTGQARANWTTGYEGFSAFPWTSRVTNLAFAPDARTLFSANWWTGQVTQWGLPSGTLVASFAYTNTIRYRFTPDASQLLVEFNDYGFEMHNPRTGALNARHPQIIGAPGSHTFSANGQRVAVWGYLASGGPVAGVWDLDTGQLLQEVPCHGYSSPCWSQVALSPDGATLALSDESRDEIAFFDVATGAAIGEFSVP